ncbi:hypothetical protein [Bradyrhizobium ivorense]|uniref:hypothetical protein n=1 Tax=Bradyrhizobium ivorense TaxID=2511166 RepID=UPI00111678A2|nr:hypothetical protein [Bradyrhizobium ivorense]
MKSQLCSAAGLGFVDLLKSNRAQILETLLTSKMTEFFVLVKTVAPETKGLSAARSSSISGR